VQYNQKDFYLKPRLLYQNRAYIIWLQDLVSEIKSIDSVRPVIVDLEVNQLSVYHAGMLIDNVNGIDGLGLVVKEDEHLDSLSAFLNRKNIRYIYSEIDVEHLIKPEIFDKNPSFFITSWRDLHESNRLTFNGVTDRKGRPKWDYFKLMNALIDSGFQIDNSKLRIIKPALPVYANTTLEFYAVIYNENMGWKYGMQVDGYSFEWSLVKCDKYGNYLAVKDVGSGPVISLKIPENHEYFRLFLTAYDGKAIITDITTLNTPLYKK
jgi:cellulose synthase (UDP-forming)